MPVVLLVLVAVVAVIGVGSATGSFWLTLLTLVLVLASNPIIRAIRKNRYFTSEEFQRLNAEVASVVSEHNDVVGYVSELRFSGSFELGASSTGQHAHLAAFENNSAWKYRRDRNVAQYAPHIYNSSLQVVRNASVDPIKYLMKYFSIKADTQTLANVQKLSDDLIRLEEAVANVRRREAGIAARIAPPKFILKHYAVEFWQRIGAKLSPIEVPYQRYVFQYTSAGGNSGQTSTIDLNTPTLEALSATLVEKIRWTKSAAGQRALMTSSLRRRIKERDNHACKRCGISVVAEPHLLLEVDHIIPVSRGGLSLPENLQTLCWKCNRTKGARLLQD